ncbi:hypothetical protein KIN20_037420 [Parelaphostrongylus tenuis]|uniref:Tetraspanin n=1 Tax=Parelaphostrongylus tenuis TaxID=148309 RepID=A0AAD5RE82_PARTN|nr:hypothetical protein KIN20_037420 [Parelaphostrongylus tenuis]
MCKIHFLGLNFLFFALGAILVGLSLWLRFDDSFVTKALTTVRLDLKNLPTESFYWILYVVIAFGAVLLILGFLGCCGSAFEVICVIGLYFTVVLILFVLKIIAVVLYFVYKSTIRDRFTDLWRSELVSKYQESQAIREALDSIQYQLQCCGATGCSDYAIFGGYPSSCQCITNPSQIGCATSIWNTLESNFIYVIIVAAIILFVELFAMIFSCVLVSAVREKRNS